MQHTPCVNMVKGKWGDSQQNLLLVSPYFTNVEFCERHSDLKRMSCAVLSHFSTVHYSQIKKENNTLSRECNNHSCLARQNTSRANFFIKCREGKVKSILSHKPGLDGKQKCASIHCGSTRALWWSDTKCEVLVGALFTSFVATHVPSYWQLTKCGLKKEKRKKSANTFEIKLLNEALRISYTQAVLCCCDYSYCGAKLPEQIVQIDYILILVLSFCWGEPFPSCWKQRSAQLTPFQLVIKPSGT